MSLIILLLSTLSLTRQLQALLYPAMSTSFSITSSVSYPVIEYFPERVILFDWCFQMSYDLPSAVSQFYNIPIWPSKQTNKITKRATYSQNLLTAEEMAKQNDTNLHLYAKYEQTATDKNRHVQDFSAGELYQGIEDFLMSHGFHETCLLRSVCELAQHPFDDQYRNVLTDIITFIFTPSLHEGFDSSEQLYRETYENAELHGFLGENCAHLYADCKRDLLSVITRIVLPNM